jgi:hypothetical protein
MHLPQARGYHFAAVYPITRAHLNRILFESKDVFCKFTGPYKPKLQDKAKLLFYLSESSREIGGEATISSLEFLSSDELIEKYESRLFIRKDELISYRGLRSNNTRLSVFTLTDIHGFDKTIRMRERISLSGRFLNEKQYGRLIELDPLQLHR